MDSDTVVVVADICGLGVHQITYFEAHADFPCVFDTESHLEGHLNVVAIHLIALEAIHLGTLWAVLDELKRVGDIGIHNSREGEIVVTGVAEAKAHGMVLALAEG